MWNISNYLIEGKGHKIKNPQINFMHKNTWQKYWNWQKSSKLLKITYIGKIRKWFGVEFVKESEENEQKSVERSEEVWAKMVEMGKEGDGPRI